MRRSVPSWLTFVLVVSALAVGNALPSDTRGKSRRGNGAQIPEKITVVVPAAKSGDSPRTGQLRISRVTVNGEQVMEQPTADDKPLWRITFDHGGNGTVSYFSQQE